ncbi:MAG TPA: carboxypeptidase-like regulatory domain-containing protein [Bacteroidia bacterium]|nr:carboxypeptidase-like regulatory domain-containing protein [Bacteroidia bacterium]
MNSKLFSLMLLVALVINSFFINTAFAQKGQAFTLEINGIVKDDDNGRAIEGAVIKITTTSGQTIQSSTTTGNGKFKFVLDPNKEYLITANKPGYTGKIVSVNTKDVDVNSGTLDYYKFPISISIFKEVPGLDVSVLNSPIGAIFYNQTLKDFDYTADKFLREAMEKMAKDMEKKKKEEEERKRKEDEDLKNKAKNDAKAQAEAEAAARKQAEEDAKNKLKNEAKAKAEAEADAKKRSAAEAEAKRKEAEEAKRLADEEAKRLAKESAAEAEARKKAEAEAIAASKREAEEAAKAKAAAQAEAEMKKREEAKLKAEEEAKARAEAKLAEMALRKSEAEAKRLAAEEAKKIYVKKIEYDTEEGANFIMTKTIITNTKDEKIVYKKIIYSWGGVYYKKEEADITQESFITDLKNVVVKTNE